MCLDVKCECSNGGGRQLLDVNKTRTDVRDPFFLPKSGGGGFLCNIDQNKCFLIRKGSWWENIVDPLRNMSARQICAEYLLMLRGGGPWIQVTRPF